MSGFAPKGMKARNKKGLALSAAPPVASEPSPADPSYSNSSGRVQDTLEIGVENFRLDLHAEDLEVIKELGAGNGGSVSKVQHKATKSIMARKVSATSTLDFQYIMAV